MSSSLAFDCHLTRITHGFDHKTCWTQARGGVIPGKQPVAVVTMQQLVLSGSDVFWGLHETRSVDRGHTWSPLREIPTMVRWKEEGGVEAVLCDATPKWHALTGKILLTGQVARYVGDHLMPDPRPRHTAYAVFNEQGQEWSLPSFLHMPDPDRYFSSGAGSAQRLDLPDGDILLPIYAKDRDTPVFESIIVRCGFDGRLLTVKEIGSSHSVSSGRGLYEPSITQYGGRYFVTYRNDQAGYVSTSNDGLHYHEPRLWCFDDGQPLGNYNTQQHWVSHSDGLFLVYTRKGLNNDHVFRHRAPLVIAQVDPEKLVVLRETERIIVPERGARLGNFSIIDFDANETWVVAAEWMQNVGMQQNPKICTQYGSDNSVWVARLHWNRPNRNLA